MNKRLSAYHGIVKKILTESKDADLVHQTSRYTFVDKKSINEIVNEAKKLASTDEFAYNFDKDTALEKALNVVIYSNPATQNKVDANTYDFLLKKLGVKQDSVYGYTDYKGTKKMASDRMKLEGIFGILASAHDLATIDPHASRKILSFLTNNAVRIAADNNSAEDDSDELDRVLQYENNNNDEEVSDEEVERISQQIMQMIRNQGNKFQQAIQRVEQLGRNKQLKPNDVQKAKDFFESSLKEVEEEVEKAFDGMIMPSNGMGIKSFSIEKLTDIAVSNPKIARSIAKYLVRKTAARIAFTLLKTKR